MMSAGINTLASDFTAIAAPDVIDGIENATLVVIGEDSEP